MPPMWRVGRAAPRDEGVDAVRLNERGRAAELAAAPREETPRTKAMLRRRLRALTAAHAIRNAIDLDTLAR
jgi:hypothetical protein